MFTPLYCQASFFFYFLQPRTHRVSIFSTDISSFSFSPLPNTFFVASTWSKNDLQKEFISQRFIVSYERKFRLKFISPRKPMFIVELWPGLQISNGVSIFDLYGGCAQFRPVRRYFLHSFLISRDEYIRVVEAKTYDSFHYVDQVLSRLV